MRTSLVSHLGHLTELQSVASNFVYSPVYPGFVVNLVILGYLNVFNMIKAWNFTFFVGACWCNPVSLQLLVFAT